MAYGGSQRTQTTRMGVSGAVRRMLDVGGGDWEITIGQDCSTAKRGLKTSIF